LASSRRCATRGRRLRNRGPRNRGSRRFSACLPRWRLFRHCSWGIAEQGFGQRTAGATLSRAYINSRM